ncbi:MAG: signal peptidase I, partial [Candidatus Omnitrophica bacterium]|nr:signal peptidase I [Candidatus Omnitrophota bacterium]
MSKEILSRRRAVRIPIIGGSMSPLFRNGDFILFEPASLNDIVIGDIVVCQRGDRMVAHRLSKIYGENGKVLLLTKGDTFTSFDPPIPSEDFLGKVIAVEKNGKRLRLNCGFGRFVNLILAKISPITALAYSIKRHQSHFPQRNLSKRKIEDEYLVRAISGRTLTPTIPPPSRGRVKDFDWDYLLDEVRRNGVSSLLYFSQKEEKENLPKEFFEQIKKDYYQTLTRNILIQEEIKPILKSFEEKNIKVILLKGIALGTTVYSSPGLRPMSDVDILIKDEDLLEVNHILNRFGYFSTDVNPENLELGKIGYLTTLDYRNKNLSFHLHRHLVNSTIPNFSYISKIKMERIWQKAKPMVIANEVK